MSKFKFEVSEDDATSKNPTARNCVHGFYRCEQCCWVGGYAEEAAMVPPDIDSVPPVPNGAIKNDAGKPPLSMIPREALEEMARAFAYGAAKYSRGNFRKSGMKWSRLTDAALRHIAAFANGEWTDPESGNSHLSHALASLAMLAFQAKHHPEENDLYEAIEAQKEVE